MAPGDDGAKFLRYEDIPYVDQLTVAPGASAAALEKAAQATAAGVRRKQVTEGEVGVYTHISEFPAGFEVARHSHDHDEMIVVLEGSLTMSADAGPDAEPAAEAPELGPSGVALLKAGLAYGFTAGPQGLRFLNIRQGLATIALEDA